jgi:hypothetical protein
MLWYGPAQQPLLTSQDGKERVGPLFAMTIRHRVTFVAAVVVVASALAGAQTPPVSSGFTIGPGIETVIIGGWTTQLEYRFSQFEQKEGLAGVAMQASD